MHTEAIKALLAVRRQLKAEAAQYRAYALNPYAMDASALLVGENALLCAVKMIDKKIAQLKADNDSTND